MIRKIGVLGISLLFLVAIVSCEKDFNDVGSSVVSNSKFETGELLLDVEITSAKNDADLNLKSVRADNISIGSLGDYWLGVYKNENHKGIEASIITQLGYVSPLKNKTVSGLKDTIYNLDKVILKIPYSATVTEVSGGITSYELDSILGDPTKPTSLKVFRNETFLKRDNPSADNPAKLNTYSSNQEYLGTNSLNENDGFQFKPDAEKDTVSSYSRINRFDTSKTYSEEVKSISSTTKKAVPFLAIPLDTTKMKALFWDKFQGDEFASKKAFDTYFYGLKIVASGESGSLVPFKLTSGASLVFHYTQSLMDGKTLKDTLNKKYSFPLSGIKNSKYKMSAATKAVASNSFVIQGTAGTMAKIKILDNTKLQELRAKKLLINDASLTFYVDQTVSTNKDIAPQRLFIYQNIDKGSKGIVPTQLTDAYKESNTFGGSLEVSEDDKPEKYTFRITDYISDLLDGTTSDISPLILKVYNNPTDDAIKSRLIDVNVRTYNWNPRGVTLLDGVETVNGTKRAVLKISYSKEK